MLNRCFPVDFNIPGFYLLDFKDKDQVEADCYFQINVKKPKVDGYPEYDFIIDSGKPYLVMESNLFRKNIPPIGTPNHYYRLGWHHFLRSGNFNNKNSPPDRWEHIKQIQNLEVKDWRTSGEHILLILQKYGDSTLNKLFDDYGTYYNWIEYAINEIRKYSDRKIIIRPHVRHTKVPFLDFISEENNVYLSETFKDRNILEGGESLEHDFKNAWAVVGYNSNTLVESTLEGIPTFPLSEESVVWDISNTSLENLETPKLNINRDQWLYDAGYMIWNLHEINNGIAWEHLKGVYFNASLER